MKDIEFARIGHCDLCGRMIPVFDSVQIVKRLMENGSSKKEAIEIFDEKYCSDSTISDNAIFIIPEERKDD